MGCDIGELRYDASINVTYTEEAVEVCPVRRSHYIIQTLDVDLTYFK